MKLEGLRATALFCPSETIQVIIVGGVMSSLRSNFCVDIPAIENLSKHIS